MNEELFYLAPETFVDRPRAWDRNDGAMYYAGLGGALDTTTGSFEQVTTTPSGYPSAPQAATTPSAQASSPWYAQIANALTSALPVAAQVYSAKKLTDLNIERARRGEAPLSPQQFVQTLPAHQVQVGPSEQAQKLLLWGGLAVGGLVLLRALKVI